MPPPDDAPLFCDRCSVVLQPGRGDHYRVTIDAVADPAPPAFDAEDLLDAPGTRRAIERLFEELEGLTEQEALDQVHRRVVLFLCVPCYLRWIENPTGS
jgi:hypothetical protein